MQSVLTHRIGEADLLLGEHIYSWRKCYLYSHHGIYAGDGRVIHFVNPEEEMAAFCSSSSSSLLKINQEACPDCRAAFRSATEGGNTVMETCLPCFLKGGELYRYQYGANKLFFLSRLRRGTCTMAESDGGVKVLHRGRYLLEHGFGKYDLRNHSCEDFALYCKTRKLLKKGAGEAIFVNGSSLAVLMVVMGAHAGSFLTSSAACAVGLTAGLLKFRYDHDIAVNEDVVDVEELVRSLGGGPPSATTEPQSGIPGGVSARQSPTRQQRQQRAAMGEDRGLGVATVIWEYGSPTGRREGRQAGSANAMRDTTGNCSPNMAGVSSDGAGEGLAAGLDGENSDCDGDDGPTADSSTNPGGGAHGRTTARPACGTRKKGEKSTTQPKKNNLWTLEEPIALARISGEDDTLMADAEGAQQHMTRTRRYEWIADGLADQGYSRTGEDCRKKWAEFQKKVREIRDACSGSGKPGYFDITTEERKTLGIPLAFEKPLWDAMEWYRKKASLNCDNTMASEDLRGTGSRGSASEASSEGGGTEPTGSAAKTRRTATGKVRGGESSSYMFGITSVMEESTRSLCEGLDKAGGNMARATTEGAALMATKMGDMATEIGVVAGAMRQGNSVFEMMVGVMASRGAGTQTCRRSRALRAAVDIDAALGFNNRLLSHFVFYVTKTGSIVPDDWTHLQVDIVGDIVENLIQNLVIEHASRLDNRAFYYTFFEKPLVGRGYLHGEVRA
ncbi:hypothetical protein CBR_g16894 [Chara braunii]|uniref:LRAT domain-containing protein n=1 Tax=Chara braunii TaxID=69332 RepID=A0A388KU22_CHABU|nr:hypothetical protein CBR_g16894 [Chara braunii]|eukprot:GBG73551.1 hypothetical protein CBR_g16894 [Chara braunii]